MTTARSWPGFSGRSGLPRRLARARGIHSAQAMNERIRAGAILALKTSDGQLVFPVSQFHTIQGDGVKVIPALVPALIALRKYDPWAVALLLRTPADELAGATPLEWARGAVTR